MAQNYISMEQAQHLAEQAVKNYAQTTIVDKALDGVAEVGNNIVKETALNSKLIAGERLYDNIEALVERYILSKLTWWQRLSVSRQNRELLILAGTYLVIHAIKSGGFGLTNYRVNHAILDYVTIACNHRIMTKVLGGFDTNLVSAMMAKPEIVKA